MALSVLNMLVDVSSIFEFSEALGDARLGDRRY